MAGTIPMKEEDGVQEIFTRDHGTIRVAGVSFMDGGHHIVLCPNGAYMHANGLPIKDVKELRAAIPKEFLDDALDWFEHRHETSEKPIRPVTFNRAGTPIFADGSVPNFDDLYAFFQPGPILTAAIVALQQHNDKNKPVSQQAAPKPKAPAKKATSAKKPAAKAAPAETSADKFVAAQAQA